jgi:ABC-type Fe3+/spermidine/putrescine transport system ATPase subunit
MGADLEKVRRRDPDIRDGAADLRQIRLAQETKAWEEKLIQERKDSEAMLAQLRQEADAREQQVRDELREEADARAERLCREIVALTQDKEEAMRLAHQQATELRELKAKLAGT